MRLTYVDGVFYWDGRKLGRPEDISLTANRLVYRITDTLVLKADYHHPKIAAGTQTHEELCFQPRPYDRRFFNPILEWGSYEIEGRLAYWHLSPWIKLLQRYDDGMTPRIRKTLQRLKKQYDLWDIVIGSFRNLTLVAGRPLIYDYGCRGEFPLKLDQPKRRKTKPKYLTA